MYKSPWLVRHSPPGGPFRLYCFSYAGGNASAYRAWPAALDPRIGLTAVQLPGRAERLCETPIASLPALIRELAREVERDASVPFAFFGHSVGALVAYELARHCQQNGLPMPGHLFVSGTSAPRHRDRSRGLHKMKDAPLIAVLKDYNGTPPEILQHSELMALVLPTMRADFALSETYVHIPDPALHIPLTVLAGRGDDYRSTEEVDGWKATTTGTCDIHWFEGDHFFIHAQRQAVVGLINSTLESLLQASQRGLRFA